MEIIDRFLDYIKIETTSNSMIEKNPSAECQLNFAKKLYQELKNMNIDDVYFDEKNCYVYAKIKGNSEYHKIGFVSHMDTSENVSGKNINPKIIKKYDGNDLILKKGIVLTVKENPELINHKGKTIITTDGTTLLGADDKAGITEIMGMLEYYKNNNLDHGDIYVCFTPDEEIGLGTLNFNYDLFNPDFAFTIDGGALGEFSYENFNAASIKIEIDGKTCHTGYAKGKMINAIRIATIINNMLPLEIPENTEEYEGFYHLEKLEGNVSYATMEYIIRDFNKEKFNEKKELIINIIEKLSMKYGNIFDITIKDTYYNMKNIVSLNEELITNTISSMKNIGIEPSIVGIRGGTDGTKISYNGIPCPNLGVGAYNFHSIYEYAVLDDMEKNCELLKELVKNIAKEKNVKQKIIRK